MRKIKFRTWHKQAKIFTKEKLIKYKNDSEWNTDGYLAINSDGVLCYDDVGNSMYELGKDITYNVDCEDYIIQQFTGVLDKNGKEIYEGDIVLAPFYGQKDGKTLDKMLVNWYNSGWSLNAISGCYGGIPIDHVRNNIEIIGNIFENPDLW